jgi:hypothetical protein
MDDTELMLALESGGTIHDLACRGNAIHCTILGTIAAVYHRQCTGPGKCFYVAMDWEHNNDVYKLKSKENLALSIQFSSGERRYRETDDHSPKG